MGKIPPNKKQENKLTWLGVTGQCSMPQKKSGRFDGWIAQLLYLIIHENHLPVEHVQN